MRFVNLDACSLIGMDLTNDKLYVPVLLNAFSVSFKDCTLDIRNMKNSFANLNKLRITSSEIKFPSNCKAFEEVKHLELID